MSTLGLGIIGLGVGKGALLLNQKSDSPIKVCAVADKDSAPGGTSTTRDLRHKRHLNRFRSRYGRCA